MGVCTLTFFTRWQADAGERDKLRAAFGDLVKESEPLARYTTARVGGPAEFLVQANSADELAAYVKTAWRLGVPAMVLGGGSNLLVSDAGVRGLVILNRADQVMFDYRTSPAVRAESGASLSLVARQCVLHGLGGLEWAVGIPGTVGGAVVGNAGAYGGDIGGCLRLAEILQLDGTVRRWTSAEMQFGYRTSALKRRLDRRPVVLAAEFALKPGRPEMLQAQIQEFTARRKRTQPAGAGMGSVFRNPPGDYAGRLIEAAGLKGWRVGEAQISEQHANFFINRGHCRAADLLALIHLAHDEVKARFGIELELEVELVGEWGGQC